MKDGIAVPVPAPPELDFAEFQRTYGPVRAMAPVEAAALFRDAPFHWWVAGGWSLELAARPRRFHEDLEIAVPRHDVPALREWLRDYHLWDTYDWTLRYLAPGLDLPVDHEQLMVRRDAYSPWLMDLLLTPVTGDTWYYKRDQRVSRPLEHVIRTGSDGVPYQRPEITLLFKARRLSEKDEADFTAVGEGLEPSDRTWLRDAIALTEPPHHSWVERLG